MATGPDLSSSSSGAAAAAAVPDAAAAARKDRHIVSWSAEEDGVLRAQIALHGTDNWTIIAAQFKDKTARQCRRRWYNYLNSECKKGGWSREEDMLLCEAQKVLGNKWTEIAKVVSGRTDNAVKNRFSTLCKRRAKDEELYQENGVPCSNTNAKRVLTETGCLTPGGAASLLHIKQMSSDLKENLVPNMRLFEQEKSTQDARQPLATISSNNQDNVNTVKSQNCVKREGNFLNKDDPKVATLLQQADLLCSLATKIKSDNTSQSMDEAWQQLQDHLMKKEHNEVPENSGSEIGSLLEELDDLIVDPYESKDEDGQKLSEHIGQTDVDNDHCNGSSQTSIEVTSNMVPEEMMKDCPVDNCKEDNSLCRNVLSGSTEPCPGAIPACGNSSKDQVAEDSNSMLQRVESTSPVITDIDDLIIDPYESEEEDEENSGEQNRQINVHDEQCFGSSQTVMEVISDMAPDEVMKTCPAGNCEEHNSICQNVLSGSMEPCPGAEILASEKLSELDEDSRLQCMEFASPVLTNFESKDCGETPAPQNLNEIAEDSRLQCIEFTSPAHTVLRDKAGVENFASPSFAVVAKDSKPPSSEFTSPAHTVATFQPYADDMPTPKFTASERNFLLSVIELTSPGSRPETSQHPSCKRALLNSL
ncbi:transcription factor MYB124 isoform X2 [Sorghum bicolor]|uniref:Uncharacterized protein n=1 Tax=Sorghum bicolor TaxID=4558 RepID=A0A1W0W7D1_SORBI|nr:transcription factor MYB124 isoform X2 [Sorghum bicolor]OQU90308.1 hypothetical protein SORBI_3002G384300 [Sorghum bicolor]|eukprot:XP_021307817.1 transcription factor MYB124 isoform X2 [Sorghum bicolor]